MTEELQDYDQELEKLCAEIEKGIANLAKEKDRATVKLFFLLNCSLMRQSENLLPARTTNQSQTSVPKLQG